MESEFSHEDLYSILAWQARQSGVATTDYIREALAQTRRRKAELDELAAGLRALAPAERGYVLEHAGEYQPQVTRDESAPSGCGFLTPLEELAGRTMDELVRTRPRRIEVCGDSHNVDSWTDVSITFVTCLVEKGLLKKQNLPLCPNPRSPKAYVNFFPGQPAGVRESGIFREAAENFFVDIKHNAKYHVLNMWRTLQTLHLEEKCPVAIGF